MAKGYAFADVNRPTSPSATPVDGGSLAANTTYYYRIIRVRSTAGIAFFWNGRSQVSDEFFATTTSTKKSIRIQFGVGDTSNYSYRIWRSTTPGGMLDAYKACLAFYPNDSVYNSGGTVTFTDTGYAESGGNVYCEYLNNAHGVFSLSGSTSTDKFSVVDLYNADQAAGWGVIQKLAFNAYKINCFLVGHTGLYWEDTEKTIIFADGMTLSHSGSTCNFGAITGSNRTYGGCNIIVASPWLTDLSFPILYAYRTMFQYLYPFVNSHLGLSSIAFNEGTVQDCQCDRFRNFIPTVTTGKTRTIKNFIFSRFDAGFVNGNAVFENVRMLSGSRVWQATSSAGNTVEGKGVYIESAAAILLAGQNNTLNAIDAEYSSDNDFRAIVNSDSTGSILNDKKSVNVKVVDGSNAPISGAAITLKNKDNNTVFSVATDVEGVIAEQYATIRYRTITGLTQSGIIGENPFTIAISKPGYKTYTATFTLSVKTAWTIALEPAIEYPAEAQVLDGVAYGQPGIAEFEGEYSLDLPPESRVIDGVAYDFGAKTGAFVAPSEAVVKRNTPYGFDGEYTGELDYRIVQPITVAASVAPIRVDVRAVRKIETSVSVSRLAVSVEVRRPRIEVSIKRKISIGVSI